ncbi:MAG: glycosyltransferase 87 family protein, partial [Melioribacteraceae bacterium]|nr:glycosyltransferase 87 family protein [Melioribacteraceae bacterium]
VTIRIIVGIIFLASVIYILFKRITLEKMIGAIFGFGIILRILLSFSEPIQEDDFNRYLWDGAVMANFINPFEYSPKEVIDDEVANPNDKEVFEILKSEAGVILERINHPHIKSIYPSISQVFFAVSYLLSPFNVTVWKLLLALVDCSVFYLLFLLITHFSISKKFIIIYWLNPILLHEIYNSGHMDILILPFVLLSILLYYKKRVFLSATFVAIAAAVKVWPIIIFPFLNRGDFSFNRVMKSGLVLAFLLVVFYLPMFLNNFGNDLGIVKYSQSWYNNDAVFHIIIYLTRFFSDIFSLKLTCPHCSARYVVLAIYVIIFVFLLLKKPESEVQMFRFFTLAVIWMFLISPTQFPWYYIWLLPFLVITPFYSILLYVVLLPLYQLNIIWSGFIYIQHLPVLVLFLMELKGKLRFNFNMRLAK